MKEIILNLLEARNIKNIKISGNEIRCCCPFHEEINPSFSINLETGKYICFSGNCGKKGNIVSFISELTGKDYKEVEKSLQINFENIKYNNIIKETLNSLIDKKDELNCIKYNSYKFVELKDLRDEDIILKLINIPKEISDIVKLKICLSNPYKRRLVVPIAENVFEFRDITKKSDKKCLYESGIKISNYLFTIIINKEDDSIFVTEGTKDAMSVAGFGFNSCCTFGVNISSKQIANILKLGINKVYVLRDNDEAGKKSAINTYKEIKKFIDCKIIKYPKDFQYKDPNEMKTKQDFIDLIKFNVRNKKI